MVVTTGNYVINERNGAGDIPLGVPPVLLLWENPCK